jgi:TetR/AcrR family transcriptional regulator
MAKRTDRGSKDRLFVAAADEFAAHGFAGANVDRIARVARVNKAMIYYHFKSKAALYGVILCDMFHAVGARVRAVVRAEISPEDKIRRFVEAIAAEADARPHFPPIWFREIAEGGKHLDAESIRDIASIVGNLQQIVEEGVRAGRFQRVNPMLLHGGIVGPLLLFLASREVRKKIERGGLRGAGAIERDAVIAHIQAVALGILQGKLA